MKGVCVKKRKEKKKGFCAVTVHSVASNEKISFERTPGICKDAERW